MTKYTDGLRRLGFSGEQIETAVSLAGNPPSQLLYFALRGAIEKRGCSPAMALQLVSDAFAQMNR